MVLEQGRKLLAVEECWLGDGKKNEKSFLFNYVAEK